MEVATHLRCSDICMFRRHFLMNLQLVSQPSSAIGCSISSKLGPWPCLYFRPLNILFGLSLCLGLWLLYLTKPAIYIYMYIYTQPSAFARCETRSILSGIWQVWIQIFFSPRWVTISKLKNLVYSIIYP